MIAPRLVFMTFLLLNLTTFATKLPKDWIRCHLNRPETSQCMAKGVQDAIRKLKNGAPELTISSFEPLFIPMLTIGEGTGPVNVAQHFKNINLHGLTNSKVTKSEVYLDKNVMFAESITPELRLEAEYEMQGRVLLLPIQGKGPCNVTLVNTKINHTLYMEPFEKKGKQHFRFKDYTVTLRPERVHFKFDHLFHGDERLGAELNKVLNENWDAVFSDVRDGYEQSFGIIFKDFANRVFTRVALADIFLFD